MTGDAPSQTPAIPPAALESLLARLRHRARKEGLRTDLVFHLYTHERFLARLASSEHRDQFILKGGLNLYSRLRALARPTVDIDLAAQRLPATVEAVSLAISEVMALELDDLLTFEASTLKADPILEGAEYGGVRLEFDAQVGTARQKLQIDVSFGNTITPGPVTLEFPALLEAQGYPLLGYPLETILAEKTAASVELGVANTRQKDFYDLYQLSLLGGLEAGGVRQAFERTFASRGLDLTSALSVLERVSLDGGMAGRWGAYLRRGRLDAPVEFGQVMQGVLALLGPLLEDTARGEWQPDSAVWVE